MATAADIRLLITNFDTITEQAKADYQSYINESAAIRANPKNYTISDAEDLAQRRTAFAQKVNPSINASQIDVINGINSLPDGDEKTALKEEWKAVVGPWSNFVATTGNKAKNEINSNAEFILKATNPEPPSNTTTGTGQGGDPTKAPSGAEGTKADDDAAGQGGSSEKIQAKQGALSQQTGVSTLIEAATSAMEDKSLQRPNGRLYNPLSKFSSYTYSLSLYMLSPEAYNMFVETGPAGFSKIKTSTDPSQAVYLVAQSGGINNTADARAITISGEPGKGVGYDFYIDDLSFTVQSVAKTGSGTANANTNFKFKIVEPYGYGFLNDLSKAAESINKASYLIQASENKPSTYQQHYVLAVRFYGYDVNGKLIDPKSLQDSPNMPPADADAAFERYFNILITKNDFKLDGKSVTYNFDAAAINLQSAYGTKRGLIPVDTNIEGSTIKEILGGSGGKSGLLDRLNQRELDMVSKGEAELANTYSIEFQPDSTLATAKVLSDAQYDPTTSASSVITGAKDNNLKAASKAGSTIQQGRKKISLRAGTHILKSIDNIIAGSTFITDALNVINGPDPEVKQDPQMTNKPLKWYAVTPLVTVKGRDTKRQDWVYNITYQIREFDVPYLRTEYANTKGKYYGPHKRYDYWFTGLNSEIISYEQQFNSLYFVTSASGVEPAPTSDNNKLGMGNVPVVKAPAAGDNTGGAGTGMTNEISNQVRTSLYSVGDQAKATIKIIGDPDFLMQDVTNNVSMLSDVFGASKRYGAGFTISPNGGQIFVEINFQQTKDYDAPTGIMKVLDNIDFYQDPRVRAAGIKGMVYQVLQVETSFRSGKFEQTLQLVIVPSSALITDTPQTSDTEQRKESTTSSGAGNTASASPRASRNPNVTAETAARTGVNLSNGSAGGGRGNGAAQLAAYRQQMSGGGSVTKKSTERPSGTNDDDNDKSKQYTRGGAGISGGR